MAMSPWNFLPGPSRRDFLRVSAAGVGVSLSGWLGVLAGRAATAGVKHKSCILLWMDGGPSHLDTFDPKPDAPDNVRGQFKPIPTSVPGIQVSELFPKLAPLMHHAAILRGMSTAEGAHGRARYYMHTGYREGSGGLVHPSLGAIVSKELGSPEFPLPNFVAIGGRSYGAGFLGAKHQPLVVNDPARGVQDLKPLAGPAHFEGRVGLLEEMETAFFREYQAGVATDHRTTYARAVTLMKSEQVKAFDLAREPASAREAYGKTRFGDGCLMARRLVEAGVPFVEVTLPGWDTHQDNFDRLKTLTRQVDPAVSALLRDLGDRGLLESTLVVWMGEFGRTPKINARGAKPGRDHYPRAWSCVLAGGGVRGGQVVGKTDKQGAAVTERPTSALDFLATVCKALGINADKQNQTPIGRPIRIVDKGHKVVSELF
jgi:uncharacterized protein (DUF1501 family)